MKAEKRTKASHWVKVIRATGAGKGQSLSFSLFEPKASLEKIRNELMSILEEHTQK